MYQTHNTGATWGGTAEPGMINQTPTGSAGMSLGTMYGIGAMSTAISGIAQASTQRYQYQIQASQAKVQKYQAQTQAAMAKMQANAQAMNLQHDFNKAMASDVVTAAAQNRRGGSVEGIASAAQDQLNWDLDLAELSGQITEGGYMANAASYGSQASAYQAAGSAAFTQGALGSITQQGMNYTIGMSLLGGKNA